jgi:hypothetical protein
MCPDHVPNVERGKAEDSTRKEEGAHLRREDKEEEVGTADGERLTADRHLNKTKENEACMPNQLPHHFFDDKPVYTAISGERQVSDCHLLGRCVWRVRLVAPDTTCPCMNVCVCVCTCSEFHLCHGAIVLCPVCVKLFPSLFGCGGQRSYTYTHMNEGTCP